MHAIRTISPGQSMRTHVRQGKIRIAFEGLEFSRLIGTDFALIANGGPFRGTLGG